MQNIGIETKQKPIQGCCRPLEEKTFWSINKEDKQLHTPSNIIGYYIRLIKSYLSSFDEFKDIDVKTALNAENEEDFSRPIVVVQRTSLAPQNTGIMNKVMLNNTGVISEADFNTLYPDANFYDSPVYSELMQMGIRAFVYGMTVAEAERVANLVYRLILATSYDVLQPTFDFIVGINPPMMGQINIIEKYSDVYFIEIDWNIDYKDDSILLMRKNVIKYAMLIVQEQEEERRKKIQERK